MRALAIVLAILMVASVAAAEKKVALEPQPSGSRALDCSNAIPINCGDVLSGDNTGMANNVASYSCVDRDEYGGEVVYELTLPAGTCQRVAVTLYPNGCDLDLFFLGSCDEADCLYYSADTGTGTDQITTLCLEPGTYYIVVDGYGSIVPGAECPFDLEVQCVECECPGPSCCPFANTVYLVDFNVGDGGYTTVPCDGAATWEWGPMTNGEVPGIACDGVPVTNILGTTIAGDYPINAGEIASVGPFTITEYCTCMELCHFYLTTDSTSGGNVKVSTDGGATWTLISPAAHYPSMVDNQVYCTPSEQVFGGLLYEEFQRDCFDITEFVGQEIMVGFFFGSDETPITKPGWYIKWLKIGSGGSSPVEEGSWGSIKAIYR